MRAHVLIEELARIPSEMNRHTSDLVFRSEKFAFNPGTVTDEVHDGANLFVRDLLQNGIFPLPYDVTLFEIGPHGLFEGGATNCLSWSLIWKEVRDGSERMFMRNFVKFPGFTSVFVNPAVAEVIYKTPDSEGWWGYFNILGLETDGLAAFERGVARLADPAMQAEVISSLDRLGFNTIAIDRGGLVSDIMADPVGGFQESCVKSLDGCFYWALNAIGLMGARGVMTPITAAPKFLNAKRKKKGKPPLFEYRTIVVDLADTKIPGAKIGSDRASPRMHWRRGHVRTLKNGVKTMVRPCLVGDKASGFIKKDYVVDISRGLAEVNFDIPVNVEEPA